MTCQYVPGKGMLVTFTGNAGGFSLVLRDDMTVANLERYLKELQSFAD